MDRNADSKKHSRAFPVHRRRDPRFPVNACNERSARAKGPTELTTEPESPMMLQRRCVTTRSIDMTSDSGLTSQDSDDARYIQEVLSELRQMQQTPRLVTSPDELV